MKRNMIKIIINKIKIDIISAKQYVSLLRTCISLGLYALCTKWIYNTTSGDKPQDLIGSLAFC